MSEPTLGDLVGFMVVIGFVIGLLLGLALMGLACAA